jgi:hypothetical protein
MMALLKFERRHDGTFGLREGRKRANFSELRRDSRTKSMRSVSVSDFYCCLICLASLKETSLRSCQITLFEFGKTVDRRKHTANHINLLTDSFVSKKTDSISSLHAGTV